ncbi:MAG: hypothetical protein ACOY33_08005 [Pseudomonadota bacterium]
MSLPVRFAVLLAGLCLVVASSTARAALDRLDDGEMAEVSGTGIAIALENFQFAMAPTSYFEQFGSTPSNPCTATGNVAANQNCWRRGDLRWFGINISDASAAGYHWNNSTACTPNAAGDCPRGGTIGWFSPFDNPYIIRAWSPQGMHYNGDCINGTDGAGGCNDAVNTTKTVYEYLAPTSQPNYILSFWGEIEAGTTRNTQTQALTVGTGGTGWGLLKSQTIIRGNAAGSVFRMFQFPQAGNQTFAMYYHSYLRGDFRFSINQGAAPVANTPGTVPVFATVEGLTFRNVSAFVPMGQLYYQALTLGAVGTAGNFYLELTPIPNNATVYNEFYGIRSGDTRGYETAKCSVPGTPTAAPAGWTACGGVNSDYAVSHGYSRWGGWYPARYGYSASADPRNTANLTTDGFVFQACSTCGIFYAFADRPVVIDKRGETASRHQTQNYNCATGNAGGCSSAAAGPITGGPGNATRTYPTAAVNLGDGRIEGLLIDHLRLESCPKTGAC